MHEFDLIGRYFKPLARDFGGSLNLTDDAALIRVPEGCELVVSKDAISEGIHFIGNEDPALIARKLLRMNLSDLAAKGATPLCYFLALMLPKPPPIPSPVYGGGDGWGDGWGEWIERFAAGLAQDQSLFGIHLAGGDTIGTIGTLCFSMTVMGTVPTGTMLRRDAARVGDTIVVSGTLGDSALGLRLLSPPPVGGRVRVGVVGEGLPVKPAPRPSPRSGEGEEQYLIQRYLLPEPRLALGQRLRGVAHASMDISDGLVQDLGHICAASGVAAEIHLERIPLSGPARILIEGEPELIEMALSGGDDYELLFTLPPGQAVPEGCSCIGEITEGNGVRLLDKRKPREIKYQGYRHF